MWAFTPSAQFWLTSQFQSPVVKKLHSAKGIVTVLSVLGVGLISGLYWLWDYLSGDLRRIGIATDVLNLVGLVWIYLSLFRGLRSIPGQLADAPISTIVHSVARYCRMAIGFWFAYYLIDLLGLVILGENPKGEAQGIFRSLVTMVQRSSLFYATLLNTWALWVVYLRLSNASIPKPLPRIGQPAAVIMLSVASGLVICQIMPGLRPEVAMGAGMVTGFIGGIVVALLIGKLDSVLIGLPRGPIAIMYTYAVLQGVFFFFFVEGDFPQIIKLVCYFYAIIGKLTLLYCLAWAIGTGGLVDYLQEVGYRNKTQAAYRDLRYRLRDLNPEEMREAGLGIEDLRGIFPNPMSMIKTHGILKEDLQRIPLTRGKYQNLLEVIGVIPRGRFEVFAVPNESIGVLTRINDSALWSFNVNLFIKPSRAFSGRIESIQFSAAGFRASGSKRGRPFKVDNVLVNFPESERPCFAGGNAELVHIRFPVKQSDLAKLIQGTRTGGRLWVDLKKPTITVLPKEGNRMFTFRASCQPNNAKQVTVVAVDSQEAH